MAATVVRTGKFISITAIDADVDLATLFAEHIDVKMYRALRVKRISFYSSGANDILVVKEATDAGAIICQDIQRVVNENICPCCCMVCIDKSYTGG